MNEIEFTLKAIELLEAINNDDLATTITLVKLLNDNYKYVDGLLGLHELIPLTEIINKTGGQPNESFLYTLNNLENIQNNEEIKWHLIITRLIIKQDKEEIKDFILQYIYNDESTLKNYQIGALVRLCVIIDDYELLADIRKRVS